MIVMEFNKETDKNLNRTTKVPRRVFQKVIKLYITGTNKNDINKVAAEIHAISVPELTGGAENRTVQITHDSTDIRQILYANI